MIELIQDKILGLSTITSCIAKTSNIARIIYHIRSTFVYSNIYTAVSTLLGGKPFCIMTEIAISKLLMQGCFARESTDKPLNSSAGWWNLRILHSRTPLRSSTGKLSYVIATSHTLIELIHLTRSSFSKVLSLSVFFLFIFYNLNKVNQICNFCF